MFDWNDLKFFLEVSRKKRFVSSARSLKVDHTTVSRRISSLENAMGTKLFEKTDLGYQLTAAGERLLPIAEKIETSAFRAQEQFAGEDFHLSGTVRVGVPDGFGSMFLGPRLPEIKDKYPNLDIELVAVPRSFSLSKREADISVALARPTAGRIIARKLTDYKLQLYASKEYLEKTGGIKNRRDLPNHRLIGYIDDLIFTPELRYMDNLLSQDSVGFRSSNLVVQLNATMAGHGICILPKFIVQPHSNLVPVLPSEIEINRTFWLLFHEDMKNLARLQAVAGFIVNLVESNKQLFLDDAPCAS